MNNDIYCHQCGKIFKTKSGLAWHSEHIHAQKAKMESLAKGDVLDQVTAEEIMRYISGDEIDRLLKLLDGELRKEGASLEKYVRELL